MSLATLGQMLRYGLVGMMTTALTYALFVGGIAIGLHYLASATIASCVVALVGYALNRRFTFAMPGKANTREFSGYLGVFAIQYVVAMVGYRVLIGGMALTPTIAFVINSAVVALITFTLLRVIPFRRAGARRA